jgi:chemotaxis signal transduction protein
VIPGYVRFRLASQSFALALCDVREIVRLSGLERLPGTVAPMAGIILLRGYPLPVLDLRAPGRAGDSGDVLVIEIAEDLVGVAVDEVLAVVSAADLPEADEVPARSLPPYVIGLRRDATGPVLLVDLQRMLDVTSQGWGDALSSGDESALVS